MYSDLEKIKLSLGVTGNYLDDVLISYADEVEGFLIQAGVPTGRITSGLVAQGVKDLWKPDGGQSELSSYFMQRAKQLAV